MLAKFISRNLFGCADNSVLMIHSGRRSGKSTATIINLVSDILYIDSQMHTRKYPRYIFWRNDTLFEGNYTILVINPTLRTSDAAFRDTLDLLEGFNWSHKVNNNLRKIVSDRGNISIRFGSVDEIIRTYVGMPPVDLVIVDEPDIMPYPYKVDDLIRALMRCTMEGGKLLIIGTDEGRGVWVSLARWVQKKFKRYIICDIISISAED